MRLSRVLNQLTYLLIGPLAKVSKWALSNNRMGRIIDIDALQSLPWSPVTRNKTRGSAHLDSLWTMTSEQRIKLLHDDPRSVFEMYRAQPKTLARNPGFSCSQTQVSGLAKWPGFVGTWVFQNPGFVIYTFRCLSPCNSPDHKRVRHQIKTNCRKIL